MITVQIGQQIDAMYIGYFSDTIPPNSITDYLLRVVKPKLDSIDGVQTAEILGGRTFALRAWLDPQRMAARGVAADDVYAALGSNNYLAGVGSTKGQMVSVDLTTNTDLQSLDEFRRLVIKRQNDALVRLEDVATVVLGAENYDFNVAFSGQRSVFIGIKVAPKANILDVAARVRAALPDLAAQLPTGVTQKLAYDATKFVTSSIKEVIKTLVEALVIVTVVIFLFLGSARAVVIPVVAMPLSLIGAFFLMLALGYSINLLTLLALVLAIGLVVDDAIIVVENVDRHLKEGVSPLEAALQAARELGGPIIAMTVVLVAAYLPIGLQGGLTGRPVHAVRLHARRRGDGLGGHRADPVADDVREGVPQRAGGGPLRALPRPQLQPAARRIFAQALELARHLAGAGAVRCAAASLRGGLCS